MASMYIGPDAFVLMRLAQLVDAMATGRASRDVLTEIRLLEDRFGLNPLSRRRLGWEIASAGQGAEGSVPLPDEVTDVRKWRQRVG